MNLKKSTSVYIKDVKSWVHVFGIVVKEGEDTLNWSQTKEREKMTSLAKREDIARKKIKGEDIWKRDKVQKQYLKKERGRNQKTT